MIELIIDNKSTYLSHKRQISNLVFFNKNCYQENILISSDFLILGLVKIKFFCFKRAIFGRIRHGLRQRFRRIVRYQTTVIYHPAEMLHQLFHQLVHRFTKRRQRKSTLMLRLSYVLQKVW